MTHKAKIRELPVLIKVSNLKSKQKGNSHDSDQQFHHQTQRELIQFSRTLDWKSRRRLPT